MKKVVFALTALALTSGTVFAAESGDGTVKFTGEIVDSPCVLSVDSQNQEVVLGQVQKSVFAAVGDKSPAKPFEIKLEDCDTTTMKKANVDSIGQRNSYVKTWGCGGFLNETNIYSRGKSLCF